MNLNTAGIKIRIILFVFLALFAKAPLSLAVTESFINTLARSVTDVVPPTLFGMHIHYAFSNNPWPTVPFAAWRLWDAGVSWRSLEPIKGEWNFSTLDKYIDLSTQHQVELLLTLGKTPQWASARPNEYSRYNQNGSAAEPANIEDWKTYVRTVANRYKGKIRYYEIWNEPNLSEYFSGTVDQMVLLAKEAYQILKEIDPSIAVVSPSVTNALGPSYLSWYFSKRGWNYCDIIGYHFYVYPNPPEAMVAVINNVKNVMNQYGVGNKPLWNTESGWAKPKIFLSDDEAAAYVARSYILNWAAGVDRFYWYAWDNHWWVTLELTDAKDYKTVKMAGIAYGEVQKWLMGAKMLSCKTIADGTWIAELSKGSSYKSWILWNPANTITFEIPRDWGVIQTRDLFGSKTKVPAGGPVVIGMVPILLENISLSPPVNLRVQHN